jgi:hypothetical protein
VSAFDRIEERRELTAGLTYEEYRERRLAAEDEMRSLFESAYDLDDPERSRFLELANEVWQERESR